MQNHPIVTANWAAMSPEAQRDCFGENGFLVVPGVLDEAEVEELLGQILECGSPQRLENELFNLPAFVSLVDHTKLVPVVQNLLGPELRFFKCAYTATPPGSIAQKLHLDQNTASYPGDFRNTSASWLNVGIYLTDLSPELAPLWVVPGSNKRYDLIPNRDMKDWLGLAKMVLAKAGDAVLFHRSTLHAAGANHSDQTRHGVFVSYRPVWAKPTGPLEEWDDEILNKVSPGARKLMQGLNDGG